MFDVESIELNNFKSFRGEHKLLMPPEPGLYNITGKNIYNPRLGANGCGKTTGLPDALCWCLYGRTTRGLRANDVVTWGQKTCWVAVTLTIGLSPLTVRRSQRPNTLTVTEHGETRTVSQAELESILRLNLKSFLHSIILPQFGSSFFDLGPSEKLTLFSDIMNLEHWLDRSKKASDVASSLEKEVTTLRAEADAKKILIRDKKRDLKELKSKASAFNSEQKKHIAKLESLKANLNGDLAKTKKSDVDIQPKLDKLDKERKDLLKSISDIEKELVAARDAASTNKGKVSAIESSVKNIDLEIRDVTKLSGGVCPECKQPVTRSHVKKHREELLSKKEEIYKGVLKLEEKISKQEFKVRDLTKKLTSAKEGMAKIVSDTSRLQHERQGIIEYSKSLNREIDDLAGQIKKEQKKPNPYAVLIKKAVASISTNEKALKKILKSIPDLETSLDGASFWVSGFKRVRLHIIEETIRTLEVEVNNALYGLGLLGWKVILDIERENKSGGITKGFSVLITNPKHPEPVRWEAWSGGEVQRLRLAGDLGLANLILERAGLVGAIEVHDEPSEHMSNEGVEDLAQTLYERAINSNKKIWLVDHRSTGFGSFAGRLTAIMSKKGFSSFSYKKGEA